MVTIVSTLKREKRNTDQQELYYKKSNTDFAGELEKAMDDLAPTDIHTVTYNSKSQLQPFFYAKRREYTI
ncbi:MAG: hypothetical protein IJP13_01720 [Lachnospiraceae bacterium]|nr:hypothetical protein [Lachnospiraceae bacterium]